MNRKVNILGTRGIPAKYGGFETFAERLALYLVDRGWEVTVYCQTDGKVMEVKSWRGIRLVEIPVPRQGAIGSILFDFKATLHSAQQDGLCLVLGYNTAIFSLLYSLKGRTSVMNMDGIEWKRDKWSSLAKAWLWLNEHCGAWLSNHMIADHPEIKNYLGKYQADERITVIPYGTDPVVKADEELLAPYGLVAGEYALVIARAEPENSIEDIVRAFSQRQRGVKLFVLGNYRPEENPYHERVLAAASEEVIFPGAIYDQETVKALRFYARLYIHGHTVGGTNPSLVEALAANSSVLAHNNRFNRWVAGTDAHYFQGESECAQKLDQLLENQDELTKMKQGSEKRYQEEFSALRDLKAYEELLISYLPQESTSTKKIVRPSID